MSPSSSPEEEVPSSPEEQDHLSNRPISPASATPEKIDDIAELNIVEDFDNRPSKKAKISESGVLEPSPMSPTMKTSSPGSEYFESIVPESDNQMNHDTLPSPPSPSSSTISPVFPLHDVKEPDSHKEIKVDETYDYLPQDYTLTDHDLCAHIAIESSLRKQLLVKIDGSSVLQNQLMCLVDEKEWVNDDDGYELRKVILGQVLTFKDNECEDNNMPAGVPELINCIRKIQSKTGSSISGRRFVRENSSNQQLGRQ